MLNQAWTKKRPKQVKLGPHSRNQRFASPQRLLLGKRCKLLVQVSDLRPGLRRGVRIPPAAEHRWVQDQKKSCQNRKARGHSNGGRKKASLVAWNPNPVPAQCVPGPRALRLKRLLPSQRPRVPVTGGVRPNKAQDPVDGLGRLTR
jgi:hypothetical protein